MSNTFIGKPCRKCGNTERYASANKPCVKCVKENSKRRHENGKTRADKQKNREKVNAYNRERYHALSPEEKRMRLRRQLLATYGMTPEDYDNKLSSQNGVCALCKKKCPTGKPLAVDHNHDTGEVRGLLCTNCNTGIGLFYERIDLFEAAVLYLDQYKSNR